MGRASLFGGLDSGLDCGTGLRDWTHGKLRSSNFEAAYTLLHTMHSLVHHVCMQKALCKNIHWRQHGSIGTGTGMYCDVFSCSHRLGIARLLTVDPFVNRLTGL